MNLWLGCGFESAINSEWGEKKSEILTFQHDESIDTSQAQFICYAGEDNLKEMLFFCETISTTITGEDIFYIFNEFICSEGFSWTNCIDQCTDAGIKSGFISKVKSVAPAVKWTRCMTYLLKNFGFLKIAARYL